MEDFNEVTLHDNECEEVVLGTLIGNPDAILEARPLLSADLFYDIYHKDLYNIVVNLEKQGKEVDMIVVCRELAKINSPIDAVKLMSIVDKRVVVNALEHVQHLQELSVRRKVIDICRINAQKATDLSTDIDDIVTNINDAISCIYQENTTESKTLTEFWKDLRTDVQANYMDKPVEVGTKTGFHKIDDKGGFHAEDLIIVAGSTSQGKTSLALSMALSAMNDNVPVAFYSMEMSGKQIAARVASIFSKIPSSKLLYGKISSIEFEEFDKASGMIKIDNMYIDEKSTSHIDKLINSIRTMIMRYHVKGVIIDYIQLVNCSVRGLNEEQSLAQAVRRLKNLAKDMGVWVLLISQLARDTQDPEPNINRLRGSGQIAEAADIVMLVYRPEASNRNSFPAPFESVPIQGKAMINMAKGRNIGIGKFICNFDAPTTHFYECTDIPEENTKTEQQQHKNDAINVPF